MVCSNFKLIYRPKLRAKQINVPNMNEMSVSLRKKKYIFEGVRFSDHHTLLRMGLVVKAGTAHFPLRNLIISNTTNEMVVNSIRTFDFYEAISGAQVQLYASERG